MSNPPAPTIGAHKQPLTAEERQAVRIWLRRDPRWREQSLLVLVSRYEATVAAQAAQRREADQRDSARLFQVVRLEADLRLAQDQRDAQAARLAAVEAALRWAVMQLDGYDASSGVGIMPAWIDWLERQVRPALAAPPGEPS